MISIVFWEVEVDWGPYLTPKIIQNMIPIVFQEVGGAGGPCPTPEFRENIIIFIVWGGRGVTRDPCPTRKIVENNLFPQFF